MPTVAPLDLDAHCIATAWIGSVPFFALADGMVHRLDEGHKWTDVHDGLSIAERALDGKSLVTGGEDGRVCSISATGEAKDLGGIIGRWVTALATGPRGAVAYGSGRMAYVRLPDGTFTDFQHPRSVEGLAFAPKGMRIAVARYNGATLHFPGAKGKPVEFEWAGAHTAATFSPDGNFLVTAMQENALHGWKLADGKHMRMAGYPAKVKSLSWSAKGRWLASSGAPAAICWPFLTKDGPIGKAPVELGTRGDAMVTAVSFHTTDDVVAIGYADGMVLAGRVADQKEILLRRAGKGTITALAWDEEGRRIAFGSEAGDCGVIDVAG